MDNSKNLTDELNFVLCPSFHGASLLSILLNNHPRILSLGDTAPTKSSLNFFCSCGQTIEKCEFWQLIESTQAHYSHKKEKHLFPITPNLKIGIVERLNRLAFGYNTFLSPWVFYSHAGRQFERSVSLFIEVALAYHKKSIFVDGTKDINRCLSIINLKKKKVRVIHLIRDPRGYFLSMRKNLPENKVTPDTTIKTWKGFHSLALHYFVETNKCSYLPVYYERLSSDPKSEMERIFKFLGVDYSDVLQKPLDPHHIIGNKMLLNFKGDIQQDLEWQQSLTCTEQKQILADCDPLSSLFHYN